MNKLYISISNGNSKMGRIPSISLPPVSSCKSGVPCAKDCYARKAYRCYKNTKNAYDRNLTIYSRDFFDYFNQIHKFLKDKMPRFFRWHVSGDIQSQFYLDKMIDLARIHPKTKFLAFTKRYEFNYNNVPENLSIVFSMWPSINIPAGRKRGVSGYAWFQDGTETRYNKENTIECPGNCEFCGMCFNLAKVKKDVVFYKH